MQGRKLIYPTYHIVRDTREKENHGWWFEPTTKYPPLCAGTVVESLKDGDYSVRGLQDIVAIERKQNFIELWNEFLDKKAFEEKVYRLSEFKHKAIFVESQLTDEVMHLCPVQIYKKFPGKVMLCWAMSLLVKYDVPVIPVGNCGEKMAQYFFYEVVKQQRDRWHDLEPSNI